MVKNISSGIVEFNENFNFDEPETQCEPDNTIRISNVNQNNIERQEQKKSYLSM